MPTLEYRLTKEELISTATVRKLARTRTLIGLGLMFLAAVLLILVGNKFSILGWALLAYVIVFPGLVALIVLSQLNANPAFTSKTTFVFSDAGVTTTANGIRTHRPWNSFVSWSQSDRYFFLHADKLGTALTVPKRAFSEVQLKMFLDQLSHAGGQSAASDSET